MSTTVAVAAASETGVFPGVPFHEYAAWKACSSTQLRHLARTPAHLRAYLDGELDTETAPKNTGRAVHCAVLEPDDFPGRYMVAEPCAATIASGKRKGEPCRAPGRTLAAGDAWLCGIHDRDAVAVPTGRELLERADYVLCMAIRDGLHTSPINAAARGLLAVCGARELSILWDQDGVRCKGRIDTETERAGALVDVKTARDAGPDAFSRAIWNFKYHVQAALYLAGMDALRPGVYDAFAFVAVEKEPPYAAAVHQLEPAALEAGMHEAERLIRRYAQCVERNEWEAYGPTINRIGLPPWARVPVDDLVELVGLPAANHQLTNGANHEHAASKD